VTAGPGEAWRPIAEVAMRGSADPAMGRINLAASYGGVELTEVQTGPTLGTRAIAVDLHWAGAGSALVDGVEHPREKFAPTVFVHLLGPPRPDGGAEWANGDGLPAGAGWAALVGPRAAGSSIVDRHWLEVDAVAPEGWYDLEIGLYDPATGLRLTHAGGGDTLRVSRAVCLPPAHSARFPGPFPWDWIAAAVSPSARCRLDA
jgi:hypothetical protein